MTFIFIKYIYKSHSSFRNSTIQYLPVPITDIIQMKITEKDRMEKVQILINKVKNWIEFYSDMNLINY
jgi:hypothetical protein